MMNLPATLSPIALAMTQKKSQNANRLWLAVCLTLSSASVVAGVRTVDNVETVTYKTNQYSITDQSVWSADGPGRSSINWELTEQQWDSVFGRPPRARVGVGGIVDECILGVCVKVGAMAGIEVETYVLPYFEADFDPGTFDASVEYKPTVTYQYGGLGVDFFKLDTDSGFDESSATFDVTSPSFRLETGLNINTDLNLFAEACLLGCFLDETYNLASFDFKLPLLEIDTINSTARIFSPPKNPIELASSLIDLINNPPNSIEELATSVLYDDISALVGQVTQNEWDDYKNGLSDADKKKINDAEQFIADSPLSLTFSNPYTDNPDSEWEDEVATAHIGGRVVDLKLDLDRVLGYAFGLPNGASLSLDDIEGFEDAPFNAEVELFNIVAGPVVNLETDLSLAPELMVELVFSAPVLIKGEIGKQTTYSGTWEDIPEIALIAPDGSTQVGEVVYNEVVTATTQFSVDAVLTNRTYIDVAAEIDIQGLRAKVGIDGFGELDTGYVFDETFTSPSLAQIDIYNDSFSTGKWVSPTDTPILPTDIARNAGTDRETGTAASVYSSSESLTFDPSGEIVFQARSKKRDDDVAGDDSRVQQLLTTQKLIDSEIQLRGYEDRTHQDIGLSTSQIFEFKDNTVKNAIENQYKIDVGQHAQVMTDGQLSNKSGSDFFIVENGGSLELAAKHPYGGSNGSLAAGESYGFVNDGVALIYGDVYMGTDSLAADELDRYKFANNGIMLIGPDGSMKFDGKFENEGYLSNQGNVELTGNDNLSSGAIDNNYNAELDIYGNIGVSREGRFGIGNTALSNSGDVTVRTGGELSLVAASKRTTQNNNNGEIIIEKGAQLTLSSKTATSAGTVALTNTHIIDNSGFVINQAGQAIINGSAGADWSAFRESSDPLAYARSLRNTDELNLLTNALNGNQVIVRTAADNSNAARQRFISASQQFVNDGKTFVENNTQGFKSNYQLLQAASQTALEASDKARQSFFDYPPNDYFKDILYSILIIKQKEYDDALTAEAGYKNSFESTASVLTNYYQKSFSADLRTAETGYGNALRNLGDARSDSVTFYQAIDGVLEEQANAGLGILVNRKDAVLLNEGTITNHAVLLNSTGGDLYNDTGATLNNDQGYLRNSGLLVNQVGGQLTNSGVIDNGLSDVRNTFGVLEMAQVVNLGQLDNSGELVNNDTLVNYGVVNNGVVNNGAAISETTIENAGIMSNLGQLNNDAIVDNNTAAEFNNHGKIVNNGSIINNGIFNNGQDPNYGKAIGDEGYNTNTFSVFDVVNDAVDFYRNQQTVGSLSNDLTKLDEQVKDSQTREGLITLQQNSLLPLITIPEDASFSQRLALTLQNNFLSLINTSISVTNSVLKLSHDITLANAQAKTALVELSRNAAQQKRQNAQAAMLGLNSVERKIYLDENGVEYEGAAFINLAAISSVNTAEIENNGTINNRGLFNNLATITNNVGGEIRNSGIFMVGTEGDIDNAGSLVLEQVTINRTSALGEEYSYEQAGTLISNGTINNSGDIDITAGALINGTLSDNVAQINNSGNIVLSGVADGTVAANGQITLTQNRPASLINQGEILNQSGGKIQIGAEDTFAANNQLFSINTLVNMKEMVNTSGAIIENNGMLINAGSINNESGSTFTNTGLLNNTETGTIDFADSATLGGFVTNNGLISMATEEILTLTGNISGNGTFAANTLLNGATVNPGNSPGLLTFDGDVTAENVNWVMEIWGTERGTEYDAIDITGDFTLMGDMTLSILSLLDFDTLISQEFEFFSITGDLFDELGGILTTSFEFFGFADEMGDNWAANWITDITGGWSLNLAFIAENADLYSELRSFANIQDKSVAVPAPGTLSIFLLGLLALGWRAKVRTKNRADS